MRRRISCWLPDALRSALRPSTVDGARTLVADATGFGAQAQRSFDALEGPARGGLPADVIDGEPGLPDMVFPANAGWCSMAGYCSPDSVTPNARAKRRPCPRLCACAWQGARQWRRCPGRFQEGAGGLPVGRHAGCSG